MDKEKIKQLIDDLGIENTIALCVVIIAIIVSIIVGIVNNVHFNFELPKIEHSQKQTVKKHKEKSKTPKVEKEQKIEQPQKQIREETKIRKNPTVDKNRKITKSTPTKQLPQKSKITDNKPANKNIPVLNSVQKNTYRTNYSIIPPSSPQTKPRPMSKPKSDLDKQADYFFD